MRVRLRGVRLGLKEGGFLLLCGPKWLQNVFVLEKLLHFLLSPHSLRLIKGAIDRPFDCNRLMLPFEEDLVEHGLSREFRIVSVLVLDIGHAFVRVEMDVFNLSPRAEMLIDDSYHVSHWCG